MTWSHSGQLDPRELAGALDDYLFNSAAARTQYTRGLPVGTKLTPAAFYSDVAGRFEDMEPACPPPPFGRLGFNSKITFVTRDSASSESAIRKISEDVARGESDQVTTVVFEGATAEEVRELRASLPEGVTPIADPDGMISKKFGVTSWPTSVLLNENGRISGFHSGLDLGANNPAGEES
jgi:hypothetical protein